MSDQTPSAGADAPVEAAGPRPGLDKKKTIIGAVIGLVALGLIFFKVIPQIGSYEDAWVAIQAMNAFDIAIIVITVVIYNTVYGFPFMAAVARAQLPALLPAQPGRVRDQQRHPRRRRVRARRAVRDARVVQGAAHRRDGRDRRHRRVERLRHPRACRCSASPAIAASGTISIGAYVYIGFIGFGVLVTMIVVFALIMRSEPLAIRIGGWANAAGPSASPHAQEGRPGPGPDGRQVPHRHRRPGEQALARHHRVAGGRLAVPVRHLLRRAARRGGRRAP